MSVTDDPRVTVLRSSRGQMMVGQVAMGLNAVFFGAVGVVGLLVGPAWIALMFLPVSLFAIVGVRQIRRRAYLITHTSICERTGFLLRETPPVRLDDVVAITWHRPRLPNRSPQGCVLWATVGGHRRGLHKMAINQVTTPEVRALQTRLEQVTGPLGAMLVNHSVLSIDDSAIVISWLRRHGFSPVPVDTEQGRGMVSYPAGVDPLAS